MSSEHPGRVGARAVAIGIVANVALAVIKTSAGYLGNSDALIADGVESISDAFSSVVLWGGLMIAARPPDADHPYGHGKAEPIATAVVSLALGVAAAAIIWHGISEMFISPIVPEPFTLVVLGFVIVGKEVLHRTLFGVGTGIQSAAVKLEAAHHRADALTSICAFVGISLALVLGSSFAPAEDAAAVLAGVIILFNAASVGRHAIGELSDVAPPLSLEIEIRRVASDVTGVVEVEKCLTRKMGFDYYVDLHVVVDGQITVRAGHSIAHRVKDRLRAEIPSIAEVLVHVEPSAEG